MADREVRELLAELPRRWTEPARPGLGEEIKQRIPHRLARHKIGWDTVNIIIDLRLSKSVAAAVIVVTMVLLLNLFGDRDSSVRGLVRDGVLLVKYWGGAGRDDIAVIRSKYEHLLHRGEYVRWYGDAIDTKDGQTVLMQQKLSDGSYVVTYVDGREREVDSEELLELLARMLQEKAK
ncbi:MAG: hypothetical protein JSW66_00330 [Phycisphaerales bacterium]|nr:MAG: hypothetical protein JSW66_00330 [Phycisphaerales bacterium]